MGNIGITELVVVAMIGLVPLGVAVAVLFIIVRNKKP